MSFLSYLLGKKATERQKGIPLDMPYLIPNWLRDIYITYLFSAYSFDLLPVFFANEDTKKLPNRKLAQWQVGESYNVIEIPEQLEKYGLTKTVAHLQAGTYLSSGDTLYLWHKNWISPVRMEFWGDNLDSVQVVDRSLTVQFSLSSVVIPYRALAKSIWGWGTTESVEAIPEIKPYFWQHGQTEIKSIPEFNEFVGQLSAANRRIILREIKKKYIDNKGYKLYVSVNDKAIVKELLGHRRFTVKKVTSPQGFVVPKEKIIVLTERELLGTIEMPNQSSWMTKLSKLRKGDYIVHQDHGVGKYLGIVRQVPPADIFGLVKSVLPQYQEGEPLDYLQIKYAGKDRLLVPIFQAAKISKYLGTSTARPKLTKLKSGRWQATKKRVEKAVEDLSKELIQLYAMREQHPVEPVPVDYDSIESFIKEFPFSDTPDQRKATKEILSDLEKNKPMDRLLVGDVGFGKTEIALRATYAVVKNHKQVAILAPTTVLSQQHFLVFQDRLEEHGIKVGILNRLHSPSEQKETIAQAKAGKIDVLIGTHRLLGKDISFKDLGLVIIDEEQNFGVKQKEKLKGLRIDVHVLSMSATPIPRTLNFSVLGIRDLSILSTPPLGRKPVKVWTGNFSWSIILQAIERELARDGQVLIIYNRVATIANFTEQLADRLNEEDILAPAVFAHGQMASGRLGDIMEQYYRGKVPILVATTIVQNGLDMPNVNTLLVMNTGRFGLAQMYQLKGRVGRSKRQAYAYFMVGAGTHKVKLTATGTRRLEAISELTDLGSGFSIASQDMAIRGVGNLLGREQHGYIDAVGFGLYQQILEDILAKQSKNIGD